MSKYFNITDFNGFSEEYATTSDPTIISTRTVTKQKFEQLHLDSLGKFMKSNGLYPHKLKQHLISSIYPNELANGNCVDHIRMGYGKSPSQFSAYQKFANLYSDSSNGYLKSDLKFSCTSQIQIALNYDHWNTAFYLDDSGWLEQQNLLRKISFKREYKKELISIIDELASKEYNLYLYCVDGYYEIETGKEFVDTLVELIEDEDIYPTIHIVKYVTINAKCNTYENIDDYVVNEFSNLLDLYNFISWNSIDNNYIN
ncbi:MAG: hypothetical protein RSA01_10915 [Clostridium sp.]